MKLILAFPPYSVLVVFSEKCASLYIQSLQLDEHPKSTSLFYSPN